MQHNGTRAVAQNETNPGNSTCSSSWGGFVILLSSYKRCYGKNAKRAFGDPSP